LLEPLKNPKVDITTLAAEIVRDEEHINPSVVKVVMAQDGRALYFTRAAAPYGEGARYHHIGVYAYRRAALEKFVSLPPSPLEMREKLEQLRALEAGLRIDVQVVDTVPLGVDTPEDLVRANEIFSGMQTRSGATPHTPPSGSGWNPTQDNNER
jgi:3-deoxy-manno-octulosonate cytidylyltransferase (CMP-KDO synthetase)